MLSLHFTTLSLKVKILTHTKNVYSKYFKLLKYVVYQARYFMEDDVFEVSAEHFFVTSAFKVHIIFVL